MQYKLYEAIFIHETYLCGFGFTFTDSRQEAWARVSNTDRASVEVYLKETDVHHCYTDKPANIEQCCVIQIVFFYRGTYWVTFLLIKMVYLPIAVTKKKIETYLGLLRWV